MDLSMFPVTAQTLWTLAGTAVWSALMTQWIKHYLPDWRWTNLLALGLTLLIVLPVGILIIAEGTLGERIVQSILMSVAGTGLATWGYEGIVNLLGKAGIGPRSPAALMQKAETLVATDPAAVARVADDNCP